MPAYSPEHNEVPLCPGAAGCGRDGNSETVMGWELSRLPPRAGADSAALCLPAAGQGARSLYGNIRACGALTRPAQWAHCVSLRRHDLGGRRSAPLLGQAMLHGRRQRRHAPALEEEQGPEGQGRANQEWIDIESLAKTNPAVQVCAVNARCHLPGPGLGCGSQHRSLCWMSPVPGGCHE